MSLLKRHVDAVLIVKDGFTGAPMAPAALRCTVDGVGFIPVTKTGGYYVFADLLPGEHELSLEAWAYRRETVRVTAGSNLTELVVTMKPAENYPFGREVTRLDLTLTRKGKKATGARICVAPVLPLLEVKLAQDELAAGDIRCRVFCKSQAAAVVPANFLLADGKATELCAVSGMAGETFTFAQPVKNAHKRGRSLYPAQIFTADEAGLVRAVFRESVELRLFAPESGAAGELTLGPGRNEAAFEL